MSISISNKLYIVLLLMLSISLPALTLLDKPVTSGNDSPASLDSSNTAFSDTTEFINAPDFTLETMQGEQFTLSEHRGKVIVLNIWATWCPPCRKEIPDFIELQDNMREDDVLFVGVSIDEEGWEVVRPFAKKYQINYPLVVDDGSIYQKYGPFRGIPTTFFINRKGQVEYVAPGMVNKDLVKPILEKLTAREYPV